MSVASTILLILGILMLIEGLFVFIFPKTTKGIVKHFTKNSKKWGITEIIVAIILIILGLTI